MPTKGDFRYGIMLSVIIEFNNYVEAVSNIIVGNKIEKQNQSKMLHFMEQLPPNKDALRKYTDALNLNASTKKVRSQCYAMTQKC